MSEEKSRREEQEALVSWAREVLEALGGVSMLGPFEIKSTHSPRRFEVSSRAKTGMLRLRASDPTEDYRDSTTTEFDAPIWLIRGQSGRSDTES